MRESEPEYEAYTVRPYAITGGKVRAASGNLPMEALVRTPEGVAPSALLTPERRRMIELATDEFQSVAELSAHTRLPLGVVRVIVMELADENLLTIHIGGTVKDESTHDEHGALTLSLLESVLDGIAAL